MSTTLLSNLLLLGPCQRALRWVVMKNEIDIPPKEMAVSGGKAIYLAPEGKSRAKERVQ